MKTTKLIQVSALVLSVAAILCGGCATGPQAAPAATKRENKAVAQQFFPSQIPDTATEAIVTKEVRRWQHDCDQEKYVNERPQPEMVGRDLTSAFMLKHQNSDIVASWTLPSANGKTFAKGLLIQTLAADAMAGGGLVSETHLFGKVWTPRASVIGKLDLSGPGKITANPDFSFDAFKNANDVIPFANGYAVNLFCQKLEEPGMVDVTARHAESYIADDGKPLYGRLVRIHGGKLEEIILAP